MSSRTAADQAYPAVPQPERDVLWAQAGGSLVKYKTFLASAQEAHRGILSEEVKKKRELAKKMSAAREHAKSESGRRVSADDLGELLGKALGRFPKNENLPVLLEFFKLCNDSDIGSKVSELRSSNQDPVNWTTIRGLEPPPPSWWAKSAVARRYFPAPSWTADGRQPLQFDCLYFNHGARCKNWRPGHTEYHTCIFCGLDHAIGCTSMVLHEAENGPCTAWRQVVTGLHFFCDNFFAEGTERAAVESVIIGEQPGFSGYLLDKYAHAYEEIMNPQSEVAPEAGGDPSATPTPAMSRQASAAVEDPEPAEGAAVPTATPNSAGREALVMHFFEQDYASAHRDRLRNQNTKHDYIWYPQEPVENDDVLVWCNANCCKLNDETRQTVRCARFYKNATLRRPEGTPAVVKVFTKLVDDTKKPDAPDRGFQKEVKGFSALYPDELLVHNDAYCFNNTGHDFPFVATRRHKQDLAKLLSGDVDRTPSVGERVSLRLELVRGVIDAMKKAHQTLIHGDVKPQNFVQVVTKSDGQTTERMMLIDFEFALPDDPDKVTCQSTTVGSHTALWSSPKQIYGTKSKPDDIFALALVIYEIMCELSGDKERSVNGPRFWIDLREELVATKPQLVNMAPARFAETRCMRLEDLDADPVPTEPPIPQVCHALVKPLLSSMFSHWAKNCQATSPQPFTFRTSFLVADPAALREILLRLHYLTEHAPSLNSLKRALKERKRRYFEFIPEVLGVFIAANSPRCHNKPQLTFDSLREQEGTLLAALATLRHTVGHPSLTPSDAMALVMWFCPHLITDLEDELAKQFSEVDRTVDAEKLGLTLFVKALGELKM